MTRLHNVVDVKFVNLKKSIRSFKNLKQSYNLSIIFSTNTL